MKHNVLNCFCGVHMYITVNDLISLKFKKGLIMQGPKYGVVEDFNRPRFCFVIFKTYISVHI